MASGGSSVWLTVAMMPREISAFMMSRLLTSAIFSPSSFTVTPSVRVILRGGPV